MAEDLASANIYLSDFVIILKCHFLLLKISGTLKNGSHIGKKEMIIHSL